jgi:transposase
LEATVARLQEERDLLKKSIAFFVRENDRPKR